VLAQALLDEAQQAGYSECCSTRSTTWRPRAACTRSLGFEEIPPYYYNPIPGAHYLKATLGVTTSTY
jgi:hypothetical protein